jgi:hypothetical protein
MPWTFLDYVDTNGCNQIEAWLESLPKGAQTPVRAKLLAILTFASAQQQLRPPRFKVLQGMEGMLEIRFTERRVAYRPLACHGPGRGEVTLLAGATKRNNQYRPPGVFETADRRRAEALSDRRRVTATCLLKTGN